MFPCCGSQATRPAERSGRTGRGTSACRSASRPRRARAEVHGRFPGGSWPQPCPDPSLAARASPKCGPFPTPSCVVSAILGTVPRSDCHRTVLDFGVALHQGMLPGLSTSTPGAGGSPQLTDQPSLHAISPTPGRFRAAPESQARTAAFAQFPQARPAPSLTGSRLDAAEFTLVTACSFASPRFDARISPNAGG